MPKIKIHHIVIITIILLINLHRMALCETTRDNNGSSKIKQKVIPSVRNVNLPNYIREEGSAWGFIRQMGGVIYDAYHMDVDTGIKELKVLPRDYYVHVRLCGGRHGSEGGYRLLIKSFAPYVNSYNLWLFGGISSKKPEDSDAIWPGFDHPTINWLREIRNLIPNHHLYSTIHLNSSQTWGIHNRSITYDEVKWLALASIGAKYNGVFLQGHDEDARLSLLFDQINKYTKELQEASIVSWAVDKSNHSLSALRNEKYLFVILLSPEWMKPSPNGDKYQLPQSDNVVMGKFTLNIPNKLCVTSGKYLSGIPVSIEKQNNINTVNYRFSGSGEILIFDIANMSKVNTDEIK